MSLNIRRKKKRQVPGLNMTSMPDLIFTVLFFFMIVTHMRNETVKVNYATPEGTEISKLEERHHIINIYIGTDINKGVPARGQNDFSVQVNDEICDVDRVGSEVRQLVSNLSPEDKENIIVNIRADKSTPMDIINSIKTQLRNANILSLRYSSLEKKE